MTINAGIAEDPYAVEADDKWFATAPIFKPGGAPHIGALSPNPWEAEVSH